MQSRPPELAPTPMKSTIVRAGAGAGKTTELTSRVINYARDFKTQSGHWPRLVVSTFTRKATQELRERLIRRACDLKDWELLQYVSSASQLHISTIHGVLSLFLRRYGRLAGLDPNFTIISDSQAQVALRRLLRQVIFNKPEYAPLLEEYRVFELMNMLARHYPLWILSNKTIQPVSKAEGEAEMNLKLKPVADELEGIVQFLSRQDISGSDDYLQFVTELKATVVAIRTNGVGEIDAILGAWPKHPHGGKKANKLFEKETTAQNQKILSDGLKVINACVSEVFTSEKLDILHQAYATLSEEIFVQWRRDKATRGQLQMEDLELLSYEILESRPDLGELFSFDWDYWLIDEYQDTSPLQDKLLDKLKGRAPAFFVGDPQQSIYLFRGARFENFEDKMKMLEAIGEEVVYKTDHYRSRGELLEFFNDFFTSTDKRFIRMNAKRDITDRKALVTNFHSFAKPEDKNSAPELFKIAAKVKALLEAGSSPKDIAILARKGQNLKNIFEFLKERQFPVQLQSSGSFQERREVLDLISFLRFLVNPHDNANLVSLLRSPWSRLKDSQIIDAAFKKSSSLWIGLNGLEDLKTNETLLSPKSLRESAGVNAATDVLEEWMLSSGLIDWSRKIDPSGRREANIWKWFHSLRVAEKQPGFNYLNWLKEFQSNPDLEKDNQEGDALSSLEPDRIQLMTIHAAKGLEFTHVLIPFCGGSRPPNDSGLWYGDLELNRYSLNVKNDIEQRRIKTCWIENISERRLIKEQEESLRVLYVAMTRAKETLTLIWTQSSQEGWSNLFEKWLAKNRDEEQTPYRVHFDSELADDVTYNPEDKGFEIPRPLFQEVREETTSPKKMSVSAVLETLEKRAEAKKLGLTEPTPAFAGFNLRKWSKAAEGVLIHRIFETLKYRENWDLTDLVQKHFPERTREVSEGLNWALELQSPPMERLIREGEVEWGYQYKAPFGLIEGQVDLWGEILEENTLWIVDYKTGKPEFEERAMRQLWLYSLALQKLKPGRKVKLAVIYPLDKKVAVSEVVNDIIKEPVIWSPQGEIQNWPNLKTTSSSL